MNDRSTLVEAFRHHYESSDSHWGGHSGGGSDAYYNIDYRMFLERFIRLNKIRSVVDIGCGDWQFSRLINWAGTRYYGFDVVESVVARNRKRYAGADISFDLMPEDFADVPDADLLIMKDVLQHLPDREIMRHRNHLFKRYPTCLISNSYRKLQTRQNVDIDYGGFRCLDLNAEPYRFGGRYVLEFSTPLWEEIRTLLYIPPLKRPRPEA